MYQRVVTKLWQGKYVSVRDYEVTKAINMGGLIITHDGKKMQLSVDELKTLKPNPKPIQSKFKGTYKLVNITFKQLNKGIYKVIGIHAKRARGLMVDFIIKNKMWQVLKMN